jgi:undecaprenyl-diphosphatase
MLKSLIAIIETLFKGIIRLDEQLLRIINSCHHPFADRIAYCIAHTLFWVPLYIVLLACIVKRFKKKSWAIVLLIVILIAICDQFASNLVKPLVQRLRPCLHPVLGGRLHVAAPYRGLYGFISSHAANTFGVVTFYCSLLRPGVGYKLLLFFWAAAISYARVYGGVHYPGDVVVGAVAGVCWAVLLYNIYRKYGPDNISIEL